MASSFSIESFVSLPPIRRAEAISAGLPAAALRTLTDDASITMTDLAKIVAPRRTLDRRLKDGGALSTDESNRLARFIGILDLATDIFGGREAAMAWLDGPKRRFDGKSPIALLDSDTGAKLVEEILQQARHGFTA